MPNAVIIAHGQPSAPGPAEVSLAQFAARVDQLAKRVTVHSATLAAPHALETLLDRLGSDCVIFPLFMAKGWFVTTALPRRIGNRSVRILDPLGVDPMLPSLVATTLGNRINRQGWSADLTDLIIAAHGSGRSRDPSRVAREFADQLSAHLPLNTVRVGFVEEPPSICDAAQGAGPQSICLPFFACTGGHVLEDIPAELERARFKGALMPAVGELDTVQHRIAFQLDKAVS